MTTELTADGMPMRKLWNSNYVKAWTANFMIYFSFMLLTPLLPIYMSETFQADKQVIGLVLSGYTIFALLIRPFSGFMVDSLPRMKVLLICYALFALFFAGYLVAGTLALFAVVRTLHGAPFGATTVCNSTIAIDVLYPERRNEGIGYYGVANNIATAIAPSLAIVIHQAFDSYNVLFAIAFVTACGGLAIDASIKLPKRKSEMLTEQNKSEEAADKKVRMSLDRFFLTKGWSESISIVCFSFSWGVMSTYVAIYGKEELGITGGTGIFFLLLSIGLILSRLTGTKQLRLGRITRNAALGVMVSLCGYLLFACVHKAWAYYVSAFIIGLGNGHMYPAFQTMYINLAPNSQRGTANSTILTSWDAGVGLGIVIGGWLAEGISYHASFWSAWTMNLLGVVWFFLHVRRHFNRYKLR